MFVFFFNLLFQKTREGNGRILFPIHPISIDSPFRPYQMNKRHCLYASSSDSFTRLKEPTPLFRNSQLHERRSPLRSTDLSPFFSSPPFAAPLPPISHLRWEDPLFFILSLIYFSFSHLLPLPHLLFPTIFLFIYLFFWTDLRNKPHSYFSHSFLLFVPLVDSRFHIVAIFYLWFDSCECSYLSLKERLIDPLELKVDLRISQIF